MISKRQQRLVNKSVSPEFEDVKAGGATAFMPFFFAQVTLPHKKTKCKYFKRGTSNLNLSIMEHPDYGIPYGMMPRLLIAWMCTEACRTRSPELYLGRNQNEFLNKLQLPSDGRYIKNLNEQILALVWSQISIKGSRVKNLNFESIQIANNGFVFWSPSHSGKIRKWTNTLTLSPDFYKAITMAPVPLHIETLHSLRKSPLAMDIYTWLVYRMFTLKVAAKWGRSNDVKIHWADLKCQFGGDYENTPQGVRSFRVNFLKQLKGVLLFYPEARNFIEEDANYLILKPGARLVVQQRLPE